jgi:hypothetical protein
LLDHVGIVNERRVRHEGMFFQHDSETGRYEDLTFGAGWQGCSRAASSKRSASHATKWPTWSGRSRTFSKTRQATRGHSMSAMRRLAPW